MNKIATVIVLSLALSGCYSRQPLGGTVPAPNDRVVATVTDTGAVAMGAMIGVGAIEVEGLVASATEQEWHFNLVRVRHRDGRDVSWNRELIAFPSHALAAPTVVKLDRTRSWIAGVAGVAGALIAARIFGIQFGGDSDERGPPGGGPPPAEFVGRGGY